MSLNLRFAEEKDVAKIDILMCGQKQLIETVWLTSQTIALGPKKFKPILKQMLDLAWKDLRDEFLATIELKDGEE